MTLFPELKEDFTAENGVTYTWDENRWRTKSFLTADGSEVEVGPVPPGDPSEGDLWYDSTRLELFVYYVDGDDNGGWVPCSPLGARVEAGEILQEQINTRLATVETDFVSKTKNSTITDGVLRLEKVEKADTALVVDFKREEEGNSNKSCRFLDLKEDNHRMMDIQTTAAGYTQIQLENDFKQFKIVGKVDGQLGQLFKVYTNGRVGLFNLRYPTADHDAASLKYVKDEIAKVDTGGGGGKFIDNFDKGYTTTQGSQTAPIGFNTVALLDSSGLATKNFASVAQVLLSWDQINPEYITKTGHIKMTDEGSDVLRGYLTVLDYKLSEGRNVAFQVVVGQYGGNTSEIGFGKRLSLTFNGVFFGTYDPLWSPS